MASLSGRVYLLAISHSAAAMKSSKTFCLCELRAGLVPGLAVFAAAAEVGLGEDAAHLQPRQPRDREARQQRNVETAVAVQQRRIRAVELDPFLMDDEHRHARAVLAAVENLLHFVIVGVELQLRPAEQAAFARGDVVVIDARRRGEAGKRVERLVVGPLAAEAAAAADARKLHVADEAGRRARTRGPSASRLRDTRR